jgi:hypothetical protein
VGESGNAICCMVERLSTRRWRARTTASAGYDAFEARIKRQGTNRSGAHLGVCVGWVLGPVTLQRRAGREVRPRILRCENHRRPERSRHCHCRSANLPCRRTPSWSFDTRKDSGEGSLKALARNCEAARIPDVFYLTRVSRRAQTAFSRPWIAPSLLSAACVA